MTKIKDDTDLIIEPGPATPGDVATAEAAELGIDADPGFTQEEAERTAAELIKLDLALREQGHTLADVLAVCARNVYGADVR